MNALTLDTLAITRKLEKSGMPREQAEALAGIQQNTINQAIEARDLATKKDLLELRADIARWLITGIMALAGIVIASIGIGVATLAWLIPGRM